MLTLMFLLFPIKTKVYTSVFINKYVPTTSTHILCDGTNFSQQLNGHPT